MEYFCFSDGGCINNGQKNAKASFSSVFIDGKEKYTISGLVKPYKYYLNAASDLTLSLASSNLASSDLASSNLTLSEIDDFDNIILVDDTTYIQPSNNRGELLGIIYSLLQLLKRGLTEDVHENTVELITDSLISVNTFNDWLPTRRKKNTAHELKNFDLLIIGEYLLNEIKQLYKSVNIIHVKSHQPKPHPSEGTRKLFIWMGNQFADQQCSILLN
jgi:ribonuclease HI